MNYMNKNGKKNEEEKIIKYVLPLNSDNNYDHDEIPIEIPLLRAIFALFWPPVHVYRNHCQSID